MPLERLDKILASTGRWSRREVKDLVRQGGYRRGGCRPPAGGQVRPRPGTEISVDGQVVDCAPFVYVLMNKPAGLLSATEDRRQRTVLDLLPEHLRRPGALSRGQTG